MSKTVHAIYIGLFVLITVLIMVGVIYNGLSYYKVSLEERYFHPDHAMFKPSGKIGHGLGITGSLCILVGVGTYMARKRYRSLSRIGVLKYWLEFHIFMCILGTIMVVFHSTFKTGGVAAISFWSMITVFASGFAGRVIYLQIPRTMEGRELDLKEVRDMRNQIIENIRGSHSLDEESIKLVTGSINEGSELNPGIKLPGFLKKFHKDRNSAKTISRILKKNNLSGSEYSRMMGLVRSDLRLGRTIGRLETMKNLFRYWHVFHLPFAILMLLFMAMHVAVTMVLGYRWLF